MTLFLTQGTFQIPIMVVMKALGMKTDQGVMQMIGRDPIYRDLLFSSIQVVHPSSGNQKDYVGNKRLELSGQLISLLFEDLFKSLISEAIDQMNKCIEKHHSSPADFSQLIKHEKMSMELERAISTGNWDIKRFKMHRKGVSQVLSRLSYMASLGYMTRVTPQFEKTRETSGPRALQPSQCYGQGVQLLHPGEEIHAPVKEEKYGNGVSDRIVRPQRDKDDVLIKKNMRVLDEDGIAVVVVVVVVVVDEDGIAAPGQIIRNHDVYVNKQSPKNTRSGSVAPLRVPAPLLADNRFHYGSAFGEPSCNADKVKDISKTLIKHGFSYNGKDFLYSGAF
ncbi:hypothetical protein PR202_gb05942 [Eleusine coracana subsp. coracana]|uniref:DNA-directed RNA polymerase n=1 Tax=Eleusine coracana subsp. coracana TaxID=191504 RepID=A0AAV5E8A5_ELECO|nr:hypothetical protein PR202_gb05942 [Eleusine coracana subsp. coracana]